tara:strand:+ start:7145 stop:7381 length:237 start_codon:yes stop_codon:yes gene_type:complete
MIDMNTIDAAMKAAAIDKSAFDLDPKVRLSEQGLDSLDTFNILLELQDETGVTVSDEEIEGLSNLELIIEHFNRAQRD